MPKTLPKTGRGSLSIRAQLQREADREAGKISTINQSHNRSRKK